ncbi:hypothetical protein KUTeg_004867 [Tegillarca granosa]|uniref:RNA helicase n=1 Tax=Tegillarca granosa TaxID=220873 RepID=A0ABQ9FMM4_TEGGR|nr:hypothetical protein KUTeg_004867 [Tegillarca granosa]
MSDDEDQQESLGFHEMGLDDRILKAISKLGWKQPTPIQEKAIPLSLEGKDILARARTGSGKTAAFSIPVIQKILSEKQVILKLEESQLPDASQLTQYHLKCEEEDKFALIYALLKLGLIRGKTILFVADVNRCYKCHVVSQFNDGLYDYIIASDETLLMNPKDVPQDKSKKKKKRDKEYGVSRGIDFQNVSNVINFDFPKSVEAYIHRVGRTARGDNQGTALSFVSIKEMPLLQNVEQTLSITSTEEDSVFKPYQFKMEEIEGFRYRAKDAMRAVTRNAVREARLKEIKQEILTSQKLKSYFEDNPRDLQLLRHDKSLHTVKVQSHMADVPEYLVPKTLKRLRRQKSKPKSDKQQFVKGPSKGEIRYKKRKADPLKSFEFIGLGSKKKRKK